MAGRVRVVVCAMARNEDDVLVAWATHLLREGVDRIVVADNLSTDRTRRLADALAHSNDKVVVTDDPDPAYIQSTKMTALAAAHCEPGDWCVPADLDECWYSLEADHTLSDTLRGLDADIAVAHPYPMVPSADDDHDNPNPFTRTAHRALHPEPQPKVAFRWRASAVIAMGNHSVGGAGDRRAEGVIGVRHHQYRTLEQVARKVRQGTAALAAGNIHASHCTHWRALAAMSDADLELWWKEYRAQETVIDPTPWRL